MPMHIYNWTDLSFGLFTAVMCVVVVIKAFRGHTLGMSKFRFGSLIGWLICAAATSLLDATHPHRRYAYKDILEGARLVAVLAFVAVTFRDKRQASTPSASN